MTSTTNTVVRACINEQIKNEAEAVLASIGLTVSDAFRMMMCIAKEKALPFEPLVPNEDTIAAIRSARHKEFITVDNLDNLVASLNAEDN